MSWNFYFEGHVLWMQGCKVVAQPAADEFGNILLWNGDIFGGKYKKASDDVGDTAALLRALAENTPAGICGTFSEVIGPWSVIYWNESRKTLWFGRDPLGRHSLLWFRNTSSITITSVTERSHSDDYLEVPAFGLFSLDFSATDPDALPIPTLHQWSHRPSELAFGIDESSGQLPGNYDVNHFNFSNVEETIKSQIDFGNLFLKVVGESQYLSIENISILPPNEALEVVRKSWVDVDVRLETFLKLLNESIKTRVKTQPGLCKNCIKDVGSTVEIDVHCTHPKVCVLFSGGIDSTVLALLVDHFVPENESIDLLNVAFAKERSSGFPHNLENSENTSGTSKKEKRKKNPRKETSIIHPAEHSFDDVPDRITGKQAVAELAVLRPNRIWNFVEIDVSVAELNEVRQDFISDLIHPLKTVLDDSLGCAMWFAARGFGTLHSIRGANGVEAFSIKESYTSPARVAILGNGADEQLGGYSRHRSALEDGGWPQLASEMSRQVRNLPARNMGRDDRICSDHGRQPRFPFLDEAVVSYLSSLAPWEKVVAQAKMPRRGSSSKLKTQLTLKPGVGDKALLRLLALQLGLRNVCTFPKRAMQFGTRVAKLESTGKEKASDVCQRLVSS
ncbi:asparagine synthetase domain-containing protein 1 isoform X2 [Ischnura elegans]|nr:asparagine synthetase domain-containing protein 1 isoform X2 [Ischnura elegans]XP_046387905.1 asparagine synthetase domain-containing protein 1 isoform X2 [Ischnura elegans]